MEKVELFLRECKKPFNYKGHDGLDRRHDTILGPNLHDACTDESAFIPSDDPWSIVASYPTPVGPPALLSRAASNGLDPAHHLDHQKFLHDKRLKILLKECKKHCTPEDIEETRSVAESASVLCHLDPNVANLAEHLAKDPAPDFKGCHNRYYGNSMVTIGNTERFLLYPQAGSLLAQEIGAERGPETSQVFTLDHGMDKSQIFQLDSSKDIISVRQIDRIGLLRFKIDEIPTLEKLFSLEESILANCFAPGELLVVTSDLKVFDLESQALKQTLKQFTDESWGCVLPQSQNVVMFCSRNNVKSIDLRSNDVDEWDVKSVTEECEEIYSACSGQSLQYVTTSHHLLSLDVRKGWYQKWTHGMSKPFISLSIPDGAGDLIFLAGDTHGDIACIQNSHTTEFDVDFIRRVPVHLPSLRDCLRDARALGHLCSPLIGPRFSMSTTGLQIVENPDHLSVYFCTSVGDLFSQRLLIGSAPWRPPEFQDGQFEIYQKWMNESRKIQIESNRPIKATSTADVSRLIDVFDNSRLAGSPKSVDVPEASQVRRPWMKSKRQLSKYCDVLAPRLMSVWDVEDDEWGVDWPSDDESSGESSSDSDEVNTRVISWLSQSDQGIKN